MIIIIIIKATLKFKDKLQSKFASMKTKQLC